MLRVTSAGLSLLLLAAGARADGTGLKESDLPRAVIDAVTQKYPGAKLSGFERTREFGRVGYEVVVSSGKDRREVNVTDDGKITGEEIKISTLEIPQDVRDGLAASKFGGWKITGAEKLVRDDGTFYELVISGKKRKAEVIFDGRGRIIEEKPKSH
jgi:hypothetical protein